MIINNKKFCPCPKIQLKVRISIFIFLLILVLAFFYKYFNNIKSVQVDRELYSIMKIDNFRRIYFFNPMTRHIKIPLTHAQLQSINQFYYFMFIVLILLLHLYSYCA